MHSSSKTTKVNVLRHEMFLTKRGEVDSSTLPPCEDSLQQHIQRANYQAGVWQRSLQRNPDVPEPTCHGWVRTDVGSLKIDWMHGHAAPDAVLELLACLLFSSLLFSSLLFSSLLFSSLHFTSLHFTSLHFTSLHCTSLHFTSLLSLPYISLNSPVFHDLSLSHAPQLAR